MSGEDYTIDPTHKVSPSRRLEVESLAHLLGRHRIQHALTAAAAIRVKKDLALRTELC